MHSFQKLKQQDNEKYIQDTILYQQTEDKGRRQDHHSLPHHHRRKEYRHYHRRGMQILRVEQQERTDNRLENQSKNRRVQRTCRKDLSGDIDKGRSGKRGTAQEPFAGDSHHADNTSCHEQGRTAIR